MALASLLTFLTVLSMALSIVSLVNVVLGALSHNSSPLRAIPIDTDFYIVCFTLKYIYSYIHMLLYVFV